MKIEPALLKKLLHLSGKDNKRIVINDHLFCSFIKRDMERIEPNYQVFSEQWRESCFPSFTQYAEVYVYDTRYGKGHHKAGFGKLYHMHHTDSNTNTFSLLLESDNTLVEVVDLTIEDEIYPIKKFMKLIDEKPLYDDVLEPYENLGLSLVEFERIGNITASIEYGLSGELYFEVIDWNGVGEGEVLSLHSDRRKFVINYEKLTEENANKLADHINRALAKRKTMEG